MSGNVTSNASNFSEFINSGVDPRTGSFSISVNLGACQSHKTSGVSLSLSLGYDAAGAMDMGFGRGWGLSLSRFNKATNMLSLSSGQSFKIEFDSALDEYRIPYRKLKDIRVFYVDDTAEIKVCHKDGTEEYFDYEEGLLRRAVSANGLVTHFEYASYNNDYALTRIYDNDGAELCIDWYSDRWKTTLEKRMNGATLYAVHFEKSDSPQRLSRISCPALDAGFSLKYRFNAAGYDLIEQVVHPSGMVEEISYRDKGHSLPTNAPMASAPFVTHYRCKMGDGQPDMVVEYEYSDKNYLGFASDQGWIAGEDTLFRARNDYRYHSIETINGSQVVMREYNKYHLMNAAEYRKDGVLYRQEKNVYFADLDAGIDWQPAQYSMLKEQHLTNYHGGRSKTVISAYDYDEAGNQTYVKQADGLEIRRTFYPATGEAGHCPAAPNGMVSLLKKETIYPVSTALGERPRDSSFSYIGLPRLNDNKAIFVVCSQQVLHDRRVDITYYADASNPWEYGRVKTQVTHLNGHAFTQHVNYQFGPLELTTEGSLATFDGLTLSSSQTTQYANGVMTRGVSPEGVATEYTYDALGRLVRETYAPGSAHEATTQYQYSVGDGVNSVTVTNAKGGVLTQQLNNAGQVIAVLATDAAGQTRQVSASQYDAFGLLVQQTDTDWLDGEALSLTTRYEYDARGEVSRVVHPDGREERFEQDLSTLTAHYEMVGLMSVETTFNLAGQELSKKTLTAEGALMASSESRYDGYGNMIEGKDTKGRITSMRHDSVDRVVAVERHIDGEALTQTVQYAPFSMNTFATQVAVNGITLGQRQYDSLARLVSEHSASGSTQLRYPNTASLLPSEKVTANGASINIDNNIYLQSPLSIASPTDASAYQYDPISGELIGDGNVNNQQVRQYNKLGQMISESVQYTDGKTASATYHYSMQGRLLSCTDFFGQQTRCTYDLFGRQDVVHTSGAAGNTSSKLTYDQHSRPVKFEMFDGRNTTVIQLTLNDKGLEARRVASINGAEVFALTQDFNDDLQITQKVHTESGATTRESMEYDDLQRLVGYRCEGPNSPRDEHGNVILGQAFSYDILGNITQVITDFSDGSRNEARFTYVANNPVQLASMTNSHPQYVSQVAFRYDAAGNLLNDERGREYQYDELGQMASVSQQGNTLSHYAYNALGQVVSQGHEDALIHLYYQGGALVNEYCDGVYSTYQGMAGAMTGRTVIDDGLSQQQVLIPNAQGSIIATQTNTADGESSYQQRRYTPYGEG